MMRARARFSIQIVLAALCLAVSAEGQAPDCGFCGTSESLLPVSSTSWTLRKEVNEVQVLFTASHDGKFVNGLAREDIAVRDNGKPASILDFRGQDNVPLRIALLVDTSDSIRKRFEFEKKTAAMFLRQTLRSEADQAMIAGFNTRLHMTQDFSHDSRALSAGLARLAPGGGTAVFDAVAEACRMLARPQEGVVARVLILVSDGDDNESKITREAAIAAAQQSDVTVYALSTGYHAGDLDGDRNLKHLALPTGGHAMFPGAVRKLASAFERISEELRHRYVLAYRPAEFAANGRFHRIQIQARKSGKKLKVRARKGYYAR
ncbi:MAG: VWA domain-containing protein [Chlamydiota bacterium]